MKIWFRGCLHPPIPLSLIDKELKFLQLNIRKQVIKVLSSEIYANIAYYQFSFPYNLRFVQTKGMRHALKP